MKALTKKYIAFGFTILSLAGCSEFEDLNSNPNAAVNATAPMLATNLILNITEREVGIQKGFLRPFFLGKSVLDTEFPEDLQYNYLGRASFDGLPVLNNVDKMVAYAPEGPQKYSFQALGKFIRAWKFFDLTMRVGDIPYSEAIRGEENVTAPKYDTQKQVFAGILNELDEADKLFAQGTRFDGDPVYGGDVLKWRKLVNTFELQVLLNLYKKTSDPDLKVQERFREIVASRPVFQNNSDNFKLVFSDKAGQRYPFYKLGNPNVIYPMVSEILIGKLKDLQDRRLFYYANPSPVQVAVGKAVSDYEAYKGTDPSMVYSDVTKIFTSKDYSGLNSRYTELPGSEPVSLLSYSQLKFILAEAALRGWISDITASQQYAEGIRASMEYVANYTPDDPMFHHNMKITQDYIKGYLDSEKVQLRGNMEEQLRQIITQKYLGTFLQARYDAFFENRRTGYPVFPINPASNSNAPADKMPVRWLYPQKELDYNTENVKQAIKDQFGGNDDFNETMWVLK